MACNDWLKRISSEKETKTVFILSVGTATVLDKITIKKNEQATHTGDNLRRRLYHSRFFIHGK